MSDLIFAWNEIIVKIFNSPEFERGLLKLCYVW